MHTQKGQNMKRKIFSMIPRQIKYLEKVSKKLQISQSEFLRRMIDAHEEQQKQRKVEKET